MPYLLEPFEPLPVLLPVETVEGGGVVAEAACFVSGMDKR